MLLFSLNVHLIHFSTRKSCSITRTFGHGVVIDLAAAWLDDKESNGGFFGLVQAFEGSVTTKPMIATLKMMIIVLMMAAGPTMMTAEGLGMRAQFQMIPGGGGGDGGGGRGVSHHHELGSRGRRRP